MSRRESVEPFDFLPGENGYELECEHAHREQSVVLSPELAGCARDVLDQAYCHPKGFVALVRSTARAGMLEAARRLEREGFLVCMYVADAEGDRTVGYRITMAGEDAARVLNAS